MSNGDVEALTTNVICHFVARQLPRLMRRPCAGTYQVELRVHHIKSDPVKMSLTFHSVLATIWTSVLRDPRSRAQEGAISTRKSSVLIRGPILSAIVPLSEFLRRHRNGEGKCSGIQKPIGVSYVYGHRAMAALNQLRRNRC